MHSLEQKNYIGQSFRIVLLAGMLLGAFSFLFPMIPGLKEVLKPYNLISAILKDKEKPSKAKILKEKHPELPPDSLAALEQYTGITFLKPFQKKLQKLKESGKGKVRIFYFGDSMIEGDLLTQSLRDTLQKIFGGEGVGFVPLTSVTAGFRKSIRHKFSDNWTHTSSIFSKKTRFPIGIGGDYFLARDSNGVQTGSYWTEYETTAAYPGTKNFPKTRLFFGRQQTDSLHPEQDAASLRMFCGELESDLFLEPRATVNEAILCASPCKRLRMEWNLPPDLPLYGISVESSRGVILDNFSLRGSSGLNLHNISSDVMHAFDSLLDPSLIILHYGLNMISKETEDFSWYEKGFNRVLEHLHKNFPGTPVLIISVTDKATKIDGNLVTDPSVPLILDVQKNVAIEQQAAFFNIFEAMGGEGAIKKWADSKPALANKDYTHPNHRGAEKLAGFITGFLLQNWDKP